MSRPFFYDIAAAKALLGQERPRTKGQVIIRERTGNRWVEARIGLVPSRGYDYHRITRAGVEYPDFKIWNDALQTAITRVEEMAKDVPATESVTLTGRQYKAFSSLNDFCADEGFDFTALPDFLRGLRLRQQIFSQNKEINETQK